MSRQHQICDFITAAIEEGFVLDRISEHLVDETLTAQSPRAEKYLGWPLLLMMRFRRGQ